MTDRNQEGQVVLEVRLTWDRQGGFRSSHGFRGPEDEQRALSWAGGGAAMIAYGLLVEAARREAYATVLAKLSEERGFLGAYMDGDGEKRRKIEGDLSRAVRGVMSAALEKMGDRPVLEVLSMMSPPGVGPG